MGRVHGRIQSRLLGGRVAGRLRRLYRSDHADTAAAPFFLGSFVDGVLIFRRRCESVVDIQQSKWLLSIGWTPTAGGGPPSVGAVLVDLFSPWSPRFIGCLPSFCLFSSRAHERWLS